MSTAVPLRRGAAGVGPVVLTLLAVAGALLPGPLSAQAGDIEVTAVEFEGNEAFPDDSLSRAIVTSATDCALIFWCPFGIGRRDAYLNPRELPRDQLRLQLYYQRRGFREAQVDTSLVITPDSTAEVTFHIVEGRPVLIDSLRFVGADGVDPSDLLDNLPLEEGDRLSILALDATRDTLTARLRNRGYASAEVLRRFLLPTDDPYSARVTYEIAPGSVAEYGDITIEGEESLAEGTILRTLQFRTGDRYSAQQIRQAQGRLFSLEIVRNASVQADTAAINRLDSIVPIRVVIQEGDEHRVRTGAGWSTAECLHGEARWVSRNFFGGARRLQLRGRLGNVLASGAGGACPDTGEGDFNDLTFLVSAQLSQPWIFSTRNSMEASLYGERQSLPDVFIREAVGASLAITRAIGPGTPLVASYRPELSRLEGAGLQFCASFLVCAPADVEVLQGANWLAPVGLLFSRIRTNNLLNPTRGYSTTLSVEHASGLTGSNFRYDRATAEGAWYSLLGSGGTVLALRGRLGWVGSGPFEGLTSFGPDAEIEVVHPQKRFYSGGANSVRGFPENRLGPRVLTADASDLLGGEDPPCVPRDIVALTCDASPLSEGSELRSFPTGGSRVVEGSVEGRFPVAPNIQGAAFVDFGRVWATREEDTSSTFEVTPGAGVRYLSPIGPLRLDLAYRFRGGQELRVITPQIRPFDPLVDEEEDKIAGPGGEPLDWVRTDDLAVLPPVLFGASPKWYQRFQLHLSIGQAF